MRSGERASRLGQHLDQRISARSQPFPSRLASLTHLTLQARRELGCDLATPTVGSLALVFLALQAIGEKSGDGLLNLVALEPRGIRATRGIIAS